MRKRQPKIFGEVVTCDHIHMKDWLKQAGCSGFTDVFHIYDLGSGCKYAFPVKSLDGWDTLQNLNNMAGSDRITLVYSDNFGSIKKAVKYIGAQWEPSHQGIHHSNAVIERSNQELTSGISTLLCQAGLPACFWPYAAPFYCFVNNLDLMLTLIA